MIRQYKQNSVVETFGDCGLIYEAKKGNKKYFMYEFDEFGEAEKYNFKVLKKILSSHILGVVEQFQENGTQYIITDYAESDLLKLQTSQPNRVFPLPVALDYFAKLIIAIQQLHDCKLVYRNIRPEAVKIRNNDVCFSDFTLSQFCKRKQRLFDLVGMLPFLAPEFFGDDGYSGQVDVWAAGVLLYYMLLGEYPFNFPDKSQENCLAEFKRKCANGFDFTVSLEQCKNPGYIKSNKLLADFFNKIFILDYTKRIRIKQIKKDKLFEGYFSQGYDQEMLQAITQQQGFSSLLMTQFMDLKKFKISYDIEKQQLILDFIEKCSDTLMLEGAEFIPENIRLKTQFAILKVALIRVNNLIDVFYGRKKPDFDTNQEQWDVIKSSTAFKRICETVEKREKILRMLFKSAKAQIPEQDDWFSTQIPDDFNDVKIPYRNTISNMFELCKTVMNKNKGNRRVMRKIIQIFTRIVILHMINRIFDEPDCQDNFAAYFQWNKGRGFENLDIWIHSQKQQVLKSFIKTTTTKYL